MIIESNSRSFDFQFTRYVKKWILIAHCCPFASLENLGNVLYQVYSDTGKNELSAEVSWGQGNDAKSLLLLIINIHNSLSDMLLLICCRINL